MNQKDQKFYAHSRSSSLYRKGGMGGFSFVYPENWQELEDHLRNVAKLASEFAPAFSSGEWGNFAGLWHELEAYGLPSNLSGRHLPRRFSQRLRVW